MTIRRKKCDGRKKKDCRKRCDSRKRGETVTRNEAADADAVVAPRRAIRDEAVGEKAESLRQWRSSTRRGHDQTLGDKNTCDSQKKSATVE